MGDVLDFLNKNAGAFSVIFTAVVTLATISYSILTYWLVKETAIMREVQTEPKLEISVRSHEVHINIMRLHVRNIGLGPALHVKFIPKVLSGGSIASNLIDALTEANFMKIGLSYFSPGHEYISGYTNMIEDGKEKIKAVLGFDVLYESSTGKRYKEEFIVDMSEHQGTRRIGGDPPLYKIAQSLEKIQKEFDHIASGFHKINVNCFSSKDRVLEEAARRAFEKEALKEFQIEKEKEKTVENPE